ncbi:energy-coupling factor transport system ATP-binding protein [Saliterribacillus persicus]|uniref:Energy-coupling factor transporter ATP-binding protein EcfA2 n=2 Tax=Saliterribacillus persicus TaxID=930114 RepID=A0A368XVH2_9BACI|nr:energy-coupling factor transport system ATP-binding protein [Saliterribacillus persicus]
MAMQIEFKSVSADYQLGPIKSKNVLKDVNLKIKTNRVTVIIGKTGSGKSTLLKLMNGLILPTSGEVKIDEHVIHSKVNKQTLKNIRADLGMVFQFPEAQLFAETVLDDIMFGPLNFGDTQESAKEKAKEVITQVGLSESIFTKSPLELSGGQKRRVAIAGVLATHPKSLILDEPGAGLDPSSKKKILDFLKSWQIRKNATMVMVTHDIEEVVNYADDLIVMKNGEIIFHDSVYSILSNLSPDNQWGIALPEARLLQLELEKKLGFKFDKICLTANQLAEQIERKGLA